MSSRPLLVGLISTMLVASVALPAEAVAPDRIRCDSVLTVDTRLSRDLTCWGDALTVRGGVQLDLGGHRVRAFGGTAVTVSGQGSPTVRNGQITRSVIGLSGSHDDDDGVPWTVTVTEVDFSDNDTGLAFLGWEGKGSSLDIADATFTHNRRGLKTTLQRGKVHVSRSTLVDNTAGVQNSDGALVVDQSAFRRNQSAINCAVSFCTLTSNQVSRNETGVAFDTDSSGPIRGNTLSDNTTAISTYLSAAGIELNTFSGNHVAVLSNWSGDQVIRNLFTKNGTGVRLGGSDMTEGLNVAWNMFVDNGDGAYADQGPVPSPYEINRVAFYGNTVLRSSGWAIYAPTAIDRGGNRAVGGAKSPECVGVVC